MVREIYALDLYVRPETDPPLVLRERDICACHNNDAIGCHGNAAPGAIRSSEAALGRLDAWVAREVTALLGAEHTPIVQAYVMSLLPRQVG